METELILGALVIATVGMGFILKINPSLHSGK